MEIFGPKESMNAARGFTVVRTAPQFVPLNYKTLGLVVLLILLTNAISFSLYNAFNRDAVGVNVEEIEQPSLYLMDKAEKYVEDETEFEDKVRDVAEDLNVPPEWLMAVMYSESRFDASVENHRGSGAVGLIQWMPTTAKELKISVTELKAMDHVDQLDYVKDYLSTVRKRYGSFQNLTELYLAILYPKALDQDYCYTLYAKPSKKYKQNRGLDENKDGRVTVSDIDKRMQRVFPTAYMAMLAEK